MPKDFKTPLQDCIDYKAKVISEIISSPAVVGLLLDDPEIDMNGDRAVDALKECIFDFDYIDRTVEHSHAFIMVEADMIAPTSGTFNQWELYVQIVCHKDYVDLNPRVFKGVRGNRRDNLMCEVDKLLNGNDIIGIGKLELKAATTAMVPDSFSSKLLTYRVIEPRRERYGGKY